MIRLPIQSSFQVLLGRPWLYKAGVLEDWKKKEFCIGPVRIPWQAPAYQGETTSESEGYTNASDAGEEEDQVSDCWMVVNAFKATTEGDLGFPQPEEEQIEVKETPIEEDPVQLLDPVVEPAKPGTEPGTEPGVQTETEPVPPVIPQPTIQKPIRREEHSLGTLDVPFTRDWVHQMLKEDPGMEAYSEYFGRSSEEDPSPIVKALEYEKLVVQDGMEFYIGRDTPEAEKEDLKKLFMEFKDVFAWSHKDLTGIDKMYGELNFRIDWKRLQGQ